MSVGMYFYESEGRVKYSSHECNIPYCRETSVIRYIYFLVCALTLSICRRFSKNRLQQQFNLQNPATTFQMWQNHPSTTYSQTER